MTALDVECPTCGAMAGRWCISRVNGVVMPENTHGTRQELVEWATEPLDNLCTCLREALIAQRAWLRGIEHGAWREDPYPDDEPWRPGCGRPAHPKRDGGG